MSEIYRTPEELPIEDFDPRLSSENARPQTIATLILLNNVETQTGVLDTESFEAGYRSKESLEQAIHLLDYSLSTGDADYLIESDGLLAKSVAHGDQRGSLAAAKYRCFIPLFSARVQRREYTAEELQESKARLEQALNYYSWTNELMSDYYYARYLRETSDTPHAGEYVDLVPKGILKIYGETPITKIQGDLKNAKGILGELFVAWMALHNKQNDRGDILYPSMHREEAPSKYEHAAHFYGLTHDLHTYDVNNPDTRELVSVKTVRKARDARGSRNPKVSLLHMAAKAAHQVNPNRGKSDSIGINTIMDYWRRAQHQESNIEYDNFYKNFVDRLSIMIQDVIDEAPEESATYH